LGLVLSGWVMAVGEGVVGRPLALELPFWLAAAGAVGLTVWGWRAVGRGFAG